MAEIIQLRELAAARERSRRRLSHQRDLEGALAVMRDNLAAVAMRLTTAAPAEQPELLSRIEQITAMIRYGMRMLSETGEPAAPDGSAVDDSRS
jgi:hypothetical protein